jgi:hypothetical protein
VGSSAPEEVAVVHVELLGEVEHGAGGRLAPEGALLVVLGPRLPHLGPFALPPLPPAEPRVARVRRHPLPAHAASDRNQQGNKAGLFRYSVLLHHGNLQPEIDPKT